MSAKIKIALLAAAIATGLFAWFFFQGEQAPSDGVTRPGAPWGSERPPLAQVEHELVEPVRELEGEAPALEPPGDSVAEPVIGTSKPYGSVHARISWGRDNTHGRTRP